MSKIFVLFASLAIVGCKTINPSTSETKIVGGTKVATDDPIAKFTVSLSDSSCSGTLIDASHVLTAAHCKPTMPNAKVVLSPDPKTATAANTRAMGEFRVHPCYETAAAKREFDVAIVKLAQPFEARDFPVIGTGNSPLQNGEALIAAGFGQRAQFNSIEDMQNYDAVFKKTPQDGLYRVDQEYFASDYSPRMIITHGPQRKINMSTCTGDSGGPIISSKGNQYRIVGVTSGGDGEPELLRYCMDLTVATKTDAYLSWISSRGVAQANEKFDCSDKRDRTKLPSPINDKVRGPSQCRLHVLADSNATYARVHSYFDDKTTDWQSTLINVPFGVTTNPDIVQEGNLLLFSAPDRIKKVAICRQADGSGNCDLKGAATKVLTAFAGGFGRNCFGTNVLDATEARKFYYNTLNQNGAILEKGTRTLKNPPPW